MKLGDGRNQIKLFVPFKLGTKKKDFKKKRWVCLEIKKGALHVAYGWFVTSFLFFTFFVFLLHRTTIGLFVPYGIWLVWVKQTRILNQPSP